MEFKGIHETAIIHENAKIGANVTVGPYAVIGENVTIGDNSIIGTSALVEGYTTIGENTRIFPKALVGTMPQDLKYKVGTKSFVEIGNNTTIRECTTINPGTDEGEKTIVGDGCLLMAYCHVAHNCVVGNEVIMANNATLAGHVEVHDFAVIGGMAPVHQFVRIGSFAMVGGFSAIVQDVIPFGLITGDPATMKGINGVGLKRRGFSSEDRMIIKKAYKILFRQKHSIPTAISIIKDELPQNENIQMILDFISNSKRGISH